MLACAVSASSAQTAPIASAPGSTQSNNAGEVNIRISVDLAQTDVVVVDHAGHPVRDLEAADFRLSDNARPQTITNFSWVQVTPSASATRVSAPKSVPGLQPASIGELKDLRRAFVLLVDDAGTSTADLAGMMPALRRFVAEQIQSGDLAAVMASRGEMGVYELLTSDKSQLNAGIERIGHRPGWLSCDYVPPFVSAMNAQHFGYVPGDFILSSNFCAPADKNGTLRRAIQTLARLPGRKAVVMFSHSFGASPANGALANQAGVAIYVLDPTDGEASKIRQPGYLGVEGTTMLANQTGGFRKLTAPGEMLADLREVLEEMSGYYVLGYHVSTASAELDAPEPQHVVRVSLARAGLTVRARNRLTHFGNDGGKNTSQTREQVLQQVLFAPVNSGELRLAMAPAYAPAARTGKTDHRRVDLQIRMAVENALAAGQTSLMLETLTAAFRSDGSTAASVPLSVSIAPITLAKAAQYRAFGILLRMRLELTEPGDYQIRVAVRDPASGRTGSAYTFLSIPDFSKASFTVATPSLGTSAWDVFAPGDRVPFSCEAFGRSARGAKGEIQLYSEAGPVGPPKSLALETSAGRYIFKGEIGIPANLTPGEYAIRFVASSATADSKKPIGLYWTRLRILGEGNASGASVKH
jgi:VWFA-related protein